jgi:HSP20 family protein
MASIRYVNASAPFWDWVASLEEQTQQSQSPREGQEEAPASEDQAGPSNTQPGQPGAFEHGPQHHGPRGGCRRGRGCGPRGGFHHFGGWAPHKNPWAFGPLADLLNGQGESQNRNESGDFTPDADVFDTESSFVVHVSLPGAKKEDIGVSWDAEKSQLTVSGVVHRPGDEELLKTLALNERKVGPFERNIRLGSRANPAQVDADMITAKLADGILRIDVPKLDKDYVEIKKVDILEIRSLDPFGGHGVAEHMAIAHETGTL